MQFHAERISIYRRYGEIDRYVFIYMVSSITDAKVAHGKAMERPWKGTYPWQSVPSFFVTKRYLSEAISRSVTAVTDRA